jgi:DmsE family decaheme c-type cytochrome
MFELNRKNCSMCIALLMVFFAWSVRGAAANPPAPSTPSGATYVGSEVCKSCHEDIHKSVEANPHFQLLNEKKTEKTEYHGCESCHGPGSAHVEAGGDKTKIFTFQGASAAEASKRCLQCHGTGTEQANFDRSVHLANDIGCTNCHSIHVAKVRKSLLQAASPTLCYQCHTEERAEFNRPFHHKVNEGLLQCSDCHNVHGSTLPKQLRTDAAQNQVCFKCHVEKKGPFVYEHLPVKTEGCTTCHMPHGSTNARLLKVNQVNMLCLQCHTQAMSNVPSQPPIGPAHNQAQKYQACTMCHAFIHGSNFSEVFFKP